MSLPDVTAAAALEAAFIAPVYFAFLDIDGDPIRANTSGANITVTGSGFAELDDEEYVGIDGRVINVSPVRNKEGGSDAVTASISGLRDIDNDTLNTIGDRANWQGRAAMLWRIIRDTTGSQQGGFQHYYTGYMTAMAISGSPDSQTIEVTIETYLAAFSKASNRTYLDQTRYDAGDLSAAAAIAIANGVSGNPIINNTQTGGWTPTAPWD